MSETLAGRRRREDDTVAAAETEVAEAERLVATLEERVREGDEDVTPEEIATAREMGRFARLRAEAAARKARKTKEAARLAACEDLRHEIEQYATGTGTELAGLLQAAQDAVTAFVHAVDSRNVQVQTWNDRIRALGIPEHISPVSPPAGHGRLGHRGSRVIAGRRVLEPLDADHWLSGMLHAVTYPSTDRRVQIAPQDTGPDLYDRLGAVDAVAPEPPADLVFFRGPNGAVSYFSPDRVPAAADLARLGLTRVSRKEAWGE